MVAHHELYGAFPVLTIFGNSLCFYGLTLYFLIWWCEIENRKTRGLKLTDIPNYKDLLDAIRKAYRDMDNGRYRIRDLAFVSVLVFTGCRLGEALELTKADLDPKERVVKIRQRKKRTEFIRLVPVPTQLFWDIMDRYLWRVEDRLFTISERQARNIVYEFTKHYLRKKIRPHAIRHSYALAVLEATRNLEVVRRLLGHSSYNTLRFYLDYTQKDLEDYISDIFMS
jgi:integrase